MSWLSFSTNHSSPSSSIRIISGPSSSLKPGCSIGYHRISFGSPADSNNILPASGVTRVSSAPFRNSSGVGEVPFA
ncbi:MAG: hypothetical protein N3G21_13550 [Candidatus Hydrogenedentes bacterium]|nr:hypothetical protein [Candidatus Hydrogenedentota bacterium]